MTEVPLTVVVDTNFIAIPAQFGVDIFSEAERVLERKLEFVILSSALDELERKILKADSKTEVRHFRIAKALAKRCKIIEAEKDTKIPVDEQLLTYAQSVKGVLATNDKDLKTRARAEGVPVLILRGMKYLALEGYVN